jgi:hypothetical protein
MYIYILIDFNLLRNNKARNSLVEIQDLVITRVITIV